MANEVKKPKSAGRPSKFHESKDRIIEAIRRGNYYEPACKAAGIEYETFRLWMRKGEEEGNGEYFGFFVEVQRAEAEAEIEVVQIWKDHMPNNWQAARDFLARRNPERWSNHDKLDLKAQTNHSMVCRLHLPSNGLNPELDHLVYDGTNAM